MSEQNKIGLTQDPEGLESKNQGNEGKSSLSLERVAKMRMVECVGSAILGCGERTRCDSWRLSLLNVDM